jgi:Coenzyme PQQ synthesis protein D (PqqD)
MDLNSSCKIPATVTARTVGTEMVILDLASGAYFGLDPVGTRIWQLMEQRRNLSEVCRVMLDEYDTSREILERDLLALAHELADKKLIDVA